MAVKVPHVRDQSNLRQDFDLEKSPSWDIEAIPAAFDRVNPPICTDATWVSKSGSFQILYQFDGPSSTEDPLPTKTVHEGLDHSQSQQSDLSPHDRSPRKGFAQVRPVFDSLRNTTGKTIRSIDWCSWFRAENPSKVCDCACPSHPRETLGVFLYTIFVVIPTLVAVLLAIIGTAMESSPINPVISYIFLQPIFVNAAVVAMYGGMMGLKPKLWCWRWWRYIVGISAMWCGVTLTGVCTTIWWAVLEGRIAEA